MDTPSRTNRVGPGQSIVVLRILLILLFLFVSACASSRVDDRPREVGIVEEEGRVVYVDLEGGFYGITTDGGARFLPLRLDPEYQRDGLRVRFRGRVQEQALTIQMWGTPIAIEGISRL